MTDNLPVPIPTELRDAFWGSIGAYSNWGADQPEPNVSLHGEPTPIDLICDLAAQYDDPMPDHLRQMLISFAPRSEEPPAGNTFASGARFLQKQIRDKRRRFQLMDRIYIGSAGPKPRALLSESVTFPHPLRTVACAPSQPPVIDNLTLAGAAFRWRHVSPCPTPYAYTR